MSSLKEVACLAVPLFPRPVRRGSRLAVAAFSGALVFCGSAVLSPSAAGEPRRLAARVEWGASVCGDARGFEARVLRRTERVKFVGKGEDVSARLSIEPRGSGLEARLALEAAGRPVLTRRLESPDCDDALDALALVLAISLEARAREPAPRPRRSRSAAAREAAPAAPGAEKPARADSATHDSPPVEVETATADGASGGSVVEPAAPPAALAPASSPSPLVEPAERGVGETLTTAPEAAPPEARDSGGPSSSSSHEAVHGLQWGAGLSAELANGIGPELMLGGGAWLRAIVDLGGVWAPALSISLSRVVLEAFPQAPAEVDFLLDSAQLALCPLRVGAGRFELRPCATGTLGRLEATGRAFYSERRARVWTALGGSLEASFGISPLLLRATLGLSAPGVRDWYRLGPPCSGDACRADAFHRISTLSTVFTLGAGVAF